MSTYQVTNVELDRASELRVEFSDGVHATFPLLDLRNGCPCAGCIGRRDQGLDAYTGASITAVDAQLHGGWGIAIRWSDGHDTGIFGWDLLRRRWEAGVG